MYFILERRTNLSNITEKSKEMARLAIKALDDTKAEDVRVLDISEVSVMADLFIIASGSSTKQVKALGDHVDEALGRAGYESKDIEGYEGAKWILMDYGDIIVHIFDDENRKFYDLERIWRDGQQIEASDL